MSGDSPSLADIRIYNLLTEDEIKFVMRFQGHVVSPSVAKEIDKICEKADREWAKMKWVNAEISMEIT